MDALFVLFIASFAVWCFANEYLPLLDLPQHVAVLSIWTHLEDPAYGFREQFELNWHTPYLVGYALARPWVGLLGAVGATKLVIVLSIAGMSLALRWLARTLGHDPWLALLGLPLSLGASFHHGFISFGLAMPLLIVCLGLALRLSPNLVQRQPTEEPLTAPETPTSDRTLSLGMSVVLLILILTHPFAYALAVGICGGLLLLGGGPKRNLVAFAPSLALFLVWFPGIVSDGERESVPEKWQLGLQRLGDFPGTLLGLGAVDRLATAFGLGLLVILISSLGRPSRKVPRYLPLAVAALGTLVFPFQFRGVSFLHERFAALVLVGLIVACEPKGPRGRPLRRLLLALLPAAWLAVLFVRTHHFNQEAEGFSALVAHMPPKLRVRPVIVENSSAAFPGSYPFVHFAAYYQAEKGGALGFSFARNRGNFVRYRTGAPRGMLRDQEWHPFQFSAKKELSNYDYILVRADKDLSALLFRNQLDRVVPDARFGDFWGYTVRDAR